MPSSQAQPYSFLTPVVKDEPCTYMSLLPTKSRTVFRQAEKMSTLTGSGLFLTGEAQVETCELQLAKYTICDWALWAGRVMRDVSCRL